MSKFQYTGAATILHLNTRKEGPDDDKELAVDIKLTTTTDDAILHMLGEGLREFLFLESGAVRNAMLGPLEFLHQIEDYRLDTMGSTHFGVKVKKLSVQPMDGYQIVLGFSVSFKPSGSEVAKIAEYLQDAIPMTLGPASEELPLDARD